MLLPFSAATVHRTLVQGLPPLPVDADKSIISALHGPILEGTMTAMTGGMGVIGPCTTTVPDVDDACLV